ncbi:MAG: regulatory protein GemA, partial [Pseudomonadota bacterium]
MLAHDARSGAKRARFKGGDQTRRIMIAKAHVAKKDLQLDEDDYRAIILDETKGQHDSTAHCDQAQLERIIKRFEARGWKSKPTRRSSKPATHPMAKKARAMWISLHQLGVVRSPKEKSLEAFAKGQLRCEKLAWAKQSHSGKLIEALKSMASEAGWAQTDEKGNNLSVRALKEGLCKAILARMVEEGEAPAHWTIDEAAWKLC